MSKKPYLFNSLFWRLSAVFVLTLLIFAGISVYLFAESVDDYTQELNQDINAELAAHTATEIAPFIENGEVNQEGMGKIMHSMMVINPSVEVYILDEQGSILSYVAPYKVVKMTEVELSPIKAFINRGDELGIIEGDDPRNLGECKIFSAAPIIENGKPIGYVYIVLASQKFVSAVEQIRGSYILGLTFRSITAVLLVSLVIGLLAFYFITKRLDRIVSTMREFQAGELGSRLSPEGGQEYALIAETFNDMASSIQENIEGLEGIDNLRKELISNISHDLRTPISSIQGYAETLEMKQGKLDAETERNYLETIVKNSQHLNKLVEGLFELSKLESGQIDLKPTPFSISELVHDVSAKYRLISQKRGISINTFLEKGSPLVMGDISMIDRVLQNLIDNAIKFCKAGDYINIELDTSDPEAVRVSIADSGQGIAKDDLDKIFDRYYKDNSKDNKRGTGLGLSIVKNIVTLHGGELDVKSQLAVGSTFSFSLPKAS